MVAVIRKYKTGTPLLDNPLVKHQPDNAARKGDSWKLCTDSVPVSASVSFNSNMYTFAHVGVI